VDVRDVENFQLLLGERVEGEGGRVLKKESGGDDFEAGGGDVDVNRLELFGENSIKNREKVEIKSEAQEVKIRPNVAVNLPEMLKKNDKKEALFPEKISGNSVKNNGETDVKNEVRKENFSPNVATDMATHLPEMLKKNGEEKSDLEVSEEGVKNEIGAANLVPEIGTFGSEKDVSNGKNFEEKDEIMDVNRLELFGENSIKNREKVEIKSEAQEVKTRPNVAVNLPEMLKKNNEKEALFPEKISGNFVKNNGKTKVKSEAYIIKSPPDMITDLPNVLKKEGKKIENRLEQINKNCAPNNRKEEVKREEQKIKIQSNVVANLPKEYEKIDEKGSTSNVIGAIIVEQQKGVIHDDVGNIFTAKIVQTLEKKENETSKTSPIGAESAGNILRKKTVENVVVEAKNVQNISQKEDTLNQKLTENFVRKNEYISLDEVRPHPLPGKMRGEKNLANITEKSDDQPVVLEKDSGKKNENILQKETKLMPVFGEASGEKNLANVVKKLDNQPIVFGEDIGKKTENISPNQVGLRPILKEAPEEKILEKFTKNVAEKVTSKEKIEVKFSEENENILPKETKPMPIFGETSGEKILANIAGKSDSQSIVAAEPIVKIGNEIVERIMLIQAVSNAKQEVIIAFNDSVLPGTQLSLVREGPSIYLNFFATNSQSFNLLAANHGELRDFLLKQLQDVNVVNIEVKEGNMDHATPRDQRQKHPRDPKKDPQSEENPHKS
jgi:hypothetical protein